jgi:hypothetical protein
VSEENLENVRRNIEHFQATGDFVDELFAPDFVWDMSQFRGWMEKQLSPPRALMYADPDEALRALGE